MLIDDINKYICNPHVIDTRGRFAHYPSEASAVSRLSGEVLGKCHRAVYYSWKKVEKTNPIDARGMWTFAFGSAIEKIYTEHTKQLGIWAGNNVKFYNMQRNVSGEADIFVFKPDRSLKGVEIKTAYGYGFQKKVKFAPKPENVMQVMLYMDYFKIPEWTLIYHSRDTQENVEYTITLQEENGLTYPVVNFALIMREFTLEDIYARYLVLGDYVVKGELPPNDFVYGYTSDKTEERFANGIISKTKFNDVSKGKVTDSDWQCLYCSYLDECWKAKRGAQKLK